MSRDTFESLVSGAASAGWEWFEKQEKLFADRSKLLPDAREARQRLAEAAARLFASEDGLLVFGHIKAATLDRVTFVTQLGIEPNQALLYGAFREGQNALYVALAKLAHEGRQDPAETTPTRRE